MEITDIEDYIETLKNDWDRDKELRDKHNDTNRWYIRDKIKGVFEEEKDMRKAINYLYDNVDFEGEIFNYYKNFGNFKNAILAMLIDNVLEKWEEEKQESKGQ